MICVDRPIFISYASRDYERVTAIADVLTAYGLPVWRDKQDLRGGDHFGTVIAAAIRQAFCLLVCCSQASLNSPNVRQEIQLAWKYRVPYLPLLLAPMPASHQIEYWLEGFQWIEVLDKAPGEWMPRLEAALSALAVSRPLAPDADAASKKKVVEPTELDRLWISARLSDRIRPILAGHRDLGALPTPPIPEFRLGTRLQLQINSDRAGHLIMLDRGPSGVVWCLCPSRFAPETRIGKGLNWLPQATCEHGSFAVTGKPGREHLLAVITEKPLCLDWVPSSDVPDPARQLSAEDLQRMTHKLSALDVGRWSAFATYFDVVV